MVFLQLRYNGNGYQPEIDLIMDEQVGQSGGIGFYEFEFFAERALLKAVQEWFGVEVTNGACFYFSVQNILKMLGAKIPF